MREILFRGKRIDNGEWIQGSFVIHGDDYYIAPDINAYTSIGGRGKGKYMLFGRYYQVVPETVGQYTGMTDKNGKKIFEGDVLNVHDQIPMFDGYDTDEIVYNGKVMYIKNQGMYVCEGNNDGNALCALNLGKCEIIGNVHDNPELLEVTK